MRLPVHRERGAVLIVALLFLVMLTLLGVTAMTSTTMEESALRDARRDLSCYPNLDCKTPYVARSLPADWPLNALNFGNNLAASTCNGGAGVSGVQGLCMPAVYSGGESAQLPATPGHSFTGPPSVQYGQFTGAPQIEGVSRQPRYLIELFCLVRHDEGLSGGAHCNFYRITAVGYGANPATSVRLQEIVAKDPA
jgi:type IV pilus assembly protein PilX